MSRRVAVIDLGSNSARMVIFERTSRLGFYILGEYKMRVRLGEGAYEHSGFITDEAMQKCYAAFVEFKKLLVRYRVRKTLAVGTSALRDAQNARVFINMVKKLGINLRVVDGDLEAYYGGFAALNLLPPFKRATTIDIGGGSTELALLENGKVIATKSLDLGTVRLKELFYDKRDLSGLEAFVKNLVSQIPPSFKNSETIAIGGSLRAISTAIIESSNYPLKAVHSFRYNFEENFDYIEKLSTAEALDLNKFFIKKDRYDTIRGGAYIFKSVAKFLETRFVTTSGVGVREGVFLTNLMGKNVKFPSNFNPSLRSLRDRFEIENRVNVAKFAKKIFTTLKPLHGLDDGYLFELDAAAKLANIGLRVSFYSKHNHSNYLVLNCLNYGYTHKQKALIATILSLNGKKGENKEFKRLLPEPKIPIWLSFILKLATILDDANDANLEFSYDNLTLEIYGLKENLFIKDKIKKMSKPDIFAISFN